MADTNALYKEADKLKSEGKFAESAAKHQELLALDPNYVYSHLALAVVYGKLQRHDLAVEHARKAVAIEPSDPTNFMALSMTYQRAWQATKDQQFIQLAEEAMARSRMLGG